MDLISVFGGYYFNFVRPIHLTQHRPGRTLRSERKTEAEGWHDLFMKVRLMDHGSKVWNLRYRINSKHKHALHRLMFPVLKAVAIKMKYNSISCMANIEQLLQAFNITC